MIFETTMERKEGKATGLYFDSAAVEM